MKQYQEILSDITERFKNKISRQELRAGSVIDFYNTAVAEVLADVHVEIENAKNPYLYSNLEGEYLDDLGILVNCSRKEGESDDNYKYRVINWKLAGESGNNKAVEVNLLDLEYASYVEQVGFSQGAGTVTYYVIPKVYSDETIANALDEVHQKVSEVAMDSLYKKYIIPTQVPIQFVVYIRSEQGDLEYIKKNLKTKIQDYVNNIAPKDYLDIGEINKIGVNESLVSYFNVVSFYVNNENRTETKVLQPIETKFLLDKIIWVED